MSLNLIDIIYENIFLKRLFPDGLTDPVFMGQIELDALGQSLSLKIHTKQKPAIEVPKWGVWGEGYEVIVIVLFATCDNLSIKNWQKNKYGELHIQELKNNTPEDRKFLITHSSQEGSIELECGMLMFQECRKYSEGVC